jgi:hypothetical protein
MPVLGLNAANLMRAFRIGLSIRGDGEDSPVFSRADQLRPSV